MSDLDTTVSLLSSSSSIYHLYRRRFYIISIFGFLAFNQCLFWLTFSPIARNAEIYYNTTEASIDLLLNWGNIICIPTFPIAYLLLNKQHGLRLSMILFAGVSLVACLLRIIPSIISSAASPQFSSIAVPFLHAGQILNAACAPLVQVSVSQVSCIWFGPNERTRATTFAITINNLGAAVGFFISPYIVDTPEHVPRLLYIHSGLALLACVLVLAYFPSYPPTPPSPAAERLTSYSFDNKKNSSFLQRFAKDLWQCMITPSFMLLSIVGGLTTGTFSTWTGLYDVILAPENYTEEQAGWFGFSSILAGIVGGFCLGALADMRRFQHSLKIL
ncbi:hypothetical protein I4U23_003863 [Adineta vaga]|nr:hypothetical protein I4U23_003863 [Adineta vaga]